MSFSSQTPIRDSYYAQIKGSIMVIAIIVLTITALLIWSKFALLDEVTTGQGKVITWSRSQVIQSRDGGVIRALLVREGDHVSAGQRIAVLDSTRFQAGFNEIGSRVKALAVAVARLQAEISGIDGQAVTPDYVDILRKYNVAEKDAHQLSDEDILAANKDIITHESSLYTMRHKALLESITGMERSRQLAQNELNMTLPLVAKGAVSEVEELRLRREVSDLVNKINETRNSWYEQSKAELVKQKTELDSLYYQLLQRGDQLSGTTIYSPVKGVVKDVQITTVGGVLEPGGKLLEVVPSEDQLLIEVKINPRDIAFIHPGQKAVVKISAYESSIYGTMKAVVDRISPDTLADETHRDQFYYQIDVRTAQSSLFSKDGKAHEISPGMIATADISTGQKTVFDYLVKPLNKAKEALRER
ncbi:HlyD family efflux transporter periplasmic adaptor subunit [Lelliottia wanjuensis]|uniref:HlyD family efflux transporter periplasmic adaptor subunit n=2 Tax=Lelliottia wanjuensis TaxID=3050585 RepID=A0AAP4LDA1_9ENTR|nr:MULTISPECIES: HlyD family efflux transporter periplasmic adaptor subunit [unclassified Lelliottia]MDK9366136.1 HlyD family efflux transporter periplasmic adaptor subunit [Lelliottia sp. V106_12]MDK9619532.1 HlyD family efflux transporter periplasmic adaptor subunit [Lelliottia sp. V106_9]